ncbi:MAG: Do family serine endopeptidase [Treponema sp.]|nr:Do family serine endopeptidase [Treponema sp.]
MKKISNLPVKILGTLSVAAVSFAILAFSCKANNGSANVAFAESKSVTKRSTTQLSNSSLEVVKSLQEVFRSVSENVLPAVVEVDVTEKTQVSSQNPFKDFWPFGDGWPFGGGSSSEPQEIEQAALGSGVIVRKSGKTVYVLTNNHVAGSATTIKIKLNDGREFDGKLVGADERMDIALVSFETTESDITIATLGNSDSVQQGDIVLALGSPLGYFASVTQGIVSATGRSGTQIGSISDFIQTDASINQGNSGGPLVNIYGEVIGINTWIASSSGGSQGLGFSIPINNIKTAIDQFISSGKVSYGWLGVSLVEPSEEYKTSLGIAKNQAGSFVAEIFMDSPAMKGGMQAGDYIISLNGKDVKGTDQLVRDVGNLKAGETAKFTVLRGKNKVELSIKIDERSQDIASDNSKLWPGFMAAPITDDARKKLKLDKNVKGIIVSGIQEKSPAAALRLQNGDIITAVNDKKVTTVQEFYEALDTSRNSTIWFDVYNDGHTISTGKYKLK